ncbi:MAG: AAA family ATPase [Magnetococcales bacterium]|nr:AAA family ATPase [Magnetococcales bacterium]
MPDTSLSTLTKRQNEILKLLRAGLSNKEVARKLDISDGTVKQHLVEIYRRLKVNNRTKAVQALSDQGDHSVFLSPMEKADLQEPGDAAPTPFQISGSIQPISFMTVRIQASETLINRLGSEGYSQLNLTLRQACQEAADRYEGVVQGSPDGLLVLFGIKRMREDDALRAACSAQWVVQTMDKEKSALELFVNSGNVVLFNEGGTTTVQGGLLSSPVKGLPMAGHRSIILSQATQVETGNLDSRYGPTSPHFPGGMLQAEKMKKAPAFTPPFTGRYEELDSLHEMVAEARQGTSSATIVSGEAGFGVTRLVRQFQKEMTANQPILWLDGHCHSTATMIPFHPLLPILEKLADCDEQATLAQKSEQLHIWAKSLDVTLAASAQQLLSYLLEKEPPPRMKQGDPLLESLTNLLATLLKGLGQPAVLFLDNLQWMDPHSRVLLPSLANALNGSHVWLLGAGRRAELRALVNLPGFRGISLSRLTGREMLRLLKELPIAKKVNRETLVSLAQWSRGAPLFAIESAARLSQLSQTKLDKAVEDADFFPDSLLSLILERLHGVPGIDWKVIRTLAILEEPTLLSTLLSLQLHGNRQATQAAAAHLVQTGLLKIVGTGEERTILFTSTMVRSAIRKTLPQSDLDMRLSPG